MGGERTSRQKASIVLRAAKDSAYAAKDSAQAALSSDNVKENAALMGDVAKYALKHYCVNLWRMLSLFFVSIAALVIASEASMSLYEQEDVMNEFFSSETCDVLKDQQQGLQHSWDQVRGLLRTGVDFEISSLVFGFLLIVADFILYLMFVKTLSKSSSLALSNFRNSKNGAGSNRSFIKVPHFRVYIMRLISALEFISGCFYIACSLAAASSDLQDSISSSIDSGCWDATTAAQLGQAKGEISAIERQQGWVGTVLLANLSLQASMWRLEKLEIRFRSLYSRIQGRRKNSKEVAVPSLDREDSLNVC